MERPGNHLVQKDHRTLRMQTSFKLKIYAFKEQKMQIHSQWHYRELLAVSLSRKALVLEISATPQASVHFCVVTCSV